MKLAKIKSFFGARLLAVLLVPAVLGCNLTTIHVSADEDVVQSAEAQAEESENTSETEQPAEDNNNNQEQGDENNAEESEGGNTEEGSQESGQEDNAGEGSGSTEESSDDAGSSSSEDSAGTGASSDSGNGSSSDGSSSSSSDSGAASSASSDAGEASSEASSTGASEASSEASSDASSSASSEGDVSGNSSEEEEDVSGNSKKKKKGGEGTYHTWGNPDSPNLDGKVKVKIKPFTEKGKDKVTIEIRVENNCDSNGISKIEFMKKEGGHYQDYWLSDTKHVKVEKGCNGAVIAYTVFYDEDVVPTKDKDSYYREYVYKVRVTDDYAEILKHLNNSSEKVIDINNDVSFDWGSDNGEQSQSDNDNPTALEVPSYDCNLVNAGITEIRPNKDEVTYINADTKVTVTVSGRDIRKADFAPAVKTTGNSENPYKVDEEWYISSVQYVYTFDSEGDGLIYLTGGEEKEEAPGDEEPGDEAPDEPGEPGEPGDEPGTQDNQGGDNLPGDGGKDKNLDRIFILDTKKPRVEAELEAGKKTIDNRQWYDNVEMSIPIVDDNPYFQTSNNEQADGNYSYAIVQKKDIWGTPLGEPEKVYLTSDKFAEIYDKDGYYDITIYPVDKANNTGNAKTYSFGVYNSQPTVSAFVLDPSNEVHNKMYYQGNVKAVVTVTDPFFSYKGEDAYTITPNSAKASVTETPDNNHGHILTFEFSEDGDYKDVGFSYKDIFDKSVSTSKNLDEFVIDTKDPEVTDVIISGKAYDAEYYTSSVKLTFKIKEDNLDTSKGVTKLVPTSGNKDKLPGLDISGKSGVYTAVAEFNADGTYNVSIEGKDLADRPLKINDNVIKKLKAFTIDTKEPKISFEGVNNYSANNGVVAPILVCTDDNIVEGSAVVTVRGANHGMVEPGRATRKTENGVVYSFEDFAHDKDVDDLYIMEAKVTDKAGHVSEDKLVFSVNRFGSVFILGDGTKSLNEMYYTNVPQDVVVTEINVDDLILRDVSVTRDGSVKQLRTETDYTASKQGSDVTWKTYTYNIGKRNFEKDGVYSVTVYTKDRATNVQDNKSRNAEINFAVDATAPSIAVAGIENKGVYKEKTHSFNIDVTDNMGVVSLAVFNNGKTVKTYTGEQLEADGNVETITLKGSEKLQNITLLAKDVAGNEEVVEYKNILVSEKAEAEDLEVLEEEEEEVVEGTDEADLPEVLSETVEAKVVDSDDNNGTTTGQGTGTVITDDGGFPVKQVAVVTIAIVCLIAAGAAGYALRKKKANNQ